MVFKASRALAKAVTRLSFNAKIHVRFQVRECDTGKGLDSEYLGLPLYIIPPITVRYKCTVVQALGFCTGRTAQKVGRGIALLFLDHDTRRG